MSTQKFSADQASDLNLPQDSVSVKLDADMYAADDIDGVTEGLAGSGNLNYLLMQSQQSSDARAFLTSEEMDKLLGDLDELDKIGTSPDPDGITQALDTDGLGEGLNLVSPLSEMNDSGPFAPVINSAISPAGASGMQAAGAQTFAAQDIFLYPDTPDDDGPRANPPGEDNPDDPPGPPDGPGPNPDPEDPPVDDDDDYDLLTDIDTDILDIALDVTLDPIEALLGDIDIDIDAILTNLLPGDHGLLPNVSVIADALLDGQEILGIDTSELLAPVDTLLNGTEEILMSLLDSVQMVLPQPLNGVVSGILDTVFNLDSLLSPGAGDTDLLLSVGAVVPGVALGDITAHIPLDIVESLLGDIDIGIDAEAVLGEIGDMAYTTVEDLLTADLAGVLNDGLVEGLDDALAGADPLNSLLDMVPVVNSGLDIAGDILPDIGAGLSTETVTDLVIDLAGGEDVIGDIAGDLGDALGGLLDSNGGPDQSGDTDLLANTDIEVLGMEIPDVDLDINLDLVENIAGDIDIDVDAAADLGNIAEVVEDVLAGDIDDLGADLGLDTNFGLLNGESGDEGILGDIGETEVGGVLDETLTWLDETVSGGLEDIGEGLLSNNPVPDVLPDPVGTITEGLGSVLDPAPILGGLSLGGGGFLGGGLFG